MTRFPRIAPLMLLLAAGTTAHAINISQVDAAGQTLCGQGSASSASCAGKSGDWHDRHAATHVGDSIYLAADTTASHVLPVPGGQSSGSFDNQKSDQTISFGTAPIVTVDGTGTVSAAGGASGNAVIFTSITPGVCTVSGTTVTGVSAGTCTIAANQAGNAGYNAAPQATQGFAIVNAGADLVMIALDSPAAGGSVDTGGSISIDDTVANQGDLGTTSEFGINVNYYLGDTLIGIRTIDYLGPGSTDAESSTFPVPATLPPGEYQLSATVDLNNFQPERNKTNNTMTAGMVTVVRDVDLVPTSLGTTATSVTAGAELTLTDTVTNVGDSPTSAPNGIRVNYYLSRDRAITAATLIGGRNISGIAAGASSTASTTVSIPATLAPGIYYLGEIVDVSNAQPENNEDNNTLMTPGTVMVVRDVDLISTGLSTTATSVRRGRSFTVSDSVKNQGTSPLAYPGGFRVNYYLFRDATPIKAGTVIGGRNIAVLAPGATNSASTLVSIPVTLAPGVYHLGEVVDVSNAQIEINKANNAAAAAGTVTVTP